MVKLNLQDLEALFNGSIWALAQAWVFGPEVTDILDATNLEITERYAGCGQVTHKFHIEDKQGGARDRGDGQ